MTIQPVPLIIPTTSDIFYLAEPLRVNLDNGSDFGCNKSFAISTIREMGVKVYHNEPRLGRRPRNYIPCDCFFCVRKVDLTYARNLGYNVRTLRLLLQHVSHTVIVPEGTKFTVVPGIRSYHFRMQDERRFRVIIDKTEQGRVLINPENLSFASFARINV